MERDFLTEALALSGYRVKELTISPHAFDIELERTDRRFVCGGCGQVHSACHDRHRIHVQDLTILGRNVYFHLWRYRVRCYCCPQPVCESIDWVPRGARMTARLAETLCEERRKTPIAAVARRYRLSWATVRKAAAA